MVHVSDKLFNSYMDNWYSFYFQGGSIILSIPIKYINKNKNCDIDIYTANDAVIYLFKDSYFYNHTFADIYTYQDADADAITFADYDINAIQDANAVFYINTDTDSNIYQDADKDADIHIHRHNIIKYADSFANKDEDLYNNTNTDMDIYQLTSAN